MKVARIFFLCFWVILVGCSSEEQVDEPVHDPVDTDFLIVAVGDSLTAGHGLREEQSYPALLQERLVADGYSCKVINSGVSGETSSGARSRIEWVLKLDPDIIILETGANDGLRGLDPKLTEENIRAILELLSERKVTVVLAGMKMAMNLGPIFVAQFNDIYPRLADDFDLIFFPFFLEGVALQPKLNQEDGIHPNQEGYERITSNIYPYVLEAIRTRNQQ